ncbi:Gas vesicle protein [Streptomyces sp. LamerLS-316]|uniref:Gas vesicle protein A n=3 Tax=Streptomyces TaxID=1883 RepID=A0AAU1LRF5_9ACTN|nr:MULTISPECIES: gas vesicle structural protein GvpA [Streptomyces]WSS69035.1 gas vesicle structural protein GvpA [Streptomyces sp. NBC_01175]MBL1289289.1 gas vesicle structural protein GvpA [Streptomyces silvae]MDX3055381.1 gas vesicle structural protein GvpA [Streptomyces sp. NE06-03E]MDX3327751.1 gas vesicle structural protein GvpA [Streptomyces sp. ME02-6979-3A]MDX3428875.1 gas vesicle structural protein GvpA [Streptomyces sp. ME01-18a]
MSLVQQSNASNSSGGGSGNLYDVLELILDRGLVIDAFIRVSLVGIEILKIDVRVVVASVDTYLRFAEACNRLDLESGRKAPAQLTDIVGDTMESGAKGKSKGALTGAVEAFTDSFQSGRDDSDDDKEKEKRPARKTSASSSSRRTAQRREE